MDKIASKTYVKFRETDRGDRNFIPQDSINRILWGTLNLSCFDDDDDDDELYSCVDVFS